MSRHPALGETFSMPWRPTQILERNVFMRFLTTASVLTWCAVAFAAEPSTRPATEPSFPAGDPVVQYWDGGLYHLDTKPLPLFVAWNDGTVICRVRNQLYRGQISPQEVAKLLERIE